jgi:hypothetical protein
MVGMYIQRQTDFRQWISLCGLCDPHPLLQIQFYLKSRSSGSWRRVLTWQDINVSEVHLTLKTEAAWTSETHNPEDLGLKYRRPESLKTRNFASSWIIPHAESMMRTKCICSVSDNCNHNVSYNKWTDVSYFQTFWTQFASLSALRTRMSMSLWRRRQW